MSHHTSTLSERRTEFTRKLILDSAIEILESGDFTMRVVSKKAGMAERSLFRYFSTRDELLDAVAAEVSRRIAPPPPPKMIEGLRHYPSALYAVFEENERIVRAGLRSVVVDRIRD